MILSRSNPSGYKQPLGKHSERVNVIKRRGLSTQPGGRAGASLDHVRVSDCGLLSGYAGYAADSITTTILSVRLVACCHQTKINFRVLHFHTYKTTPWVTRRLGEDERERERDIERLGDRKR